MALLGGKRKREREGKRGGEKKEFAATAQGQSSDKQEGENDEMRLSVFPHLFFRIPVRPLTIKK